MPAPSPNLSSLSTTSPVASDNAALGAANIVAVAAALVNTFGYEHFLTGEHGIQRGAILPADIGNSTKAALFIKTTGGVDDLYMSVGTGTWINLTNNASYSLNAAALTTHKTAATIDHPDGSITSTKYGAGSILSAAIGTGQVLASHFAVAIQNLINGGNADALHTHGSASGRQEFTTNGNFTVPSGITKIWVTAIGGGGGGGYGGGYGGGGGGGGEIYVDVVFTVVPGAIYAVTIGSGGVGGSGGGAGGAGGNTVFPYATWSLTAVGGGGGQPGILSVGAGGAAGGVGSTAGDIGGAAGNPQNGGNGGDSLQGKGGTHGVYLGASPSIGFGLGAGGGGGQGGAIAGAAGTNGYMLIRW